LPVKAWLQAARICEGPLFRPEAYAARLGLSRLTSAHIPWEPAS
jgi:hypothetical protein